MMVSYTEGNGKSSPMKALPQPQTTSSGLRGNRSRYTLESPPPAAHISYKPEMVGEQFGWVKIISPEKRWNQKQNHCYVLTQCMGCGSVQWQLRTNLTSGKSKGCQSCTQKRPIPSWLEKRLAAAKQRCENPHDSQYPNYGARGIRFDFPSVIEAGLYLIGQYGHLERKMELDRIDNNGNYAPGNIRLVTRQENCANRRTTVLGRFEQKYWPYSQNVVVRKLSAGQTRDEIIQDAQTAVFEKRKNWRLISARLDFMIYEMPDDITVLPYRDTSSTTVDTAVPLVH